MPMKKLKGGRVCVFIKSVAGPEFDFTRVGRDFDNGGGMLGEGGDNHWKC